MSVLTNLSIYKVVTKENHSKTSREIKVFGIKKVNKFRNFSLLSFLGLTSVACNSTSDEQCYGSLGIFVGSLCASQNDASVESVVKLDKTNVAGTHFLTTNIDESGNPQFDRIEFESPVEVIGTKYTLTSGDILKNASLVKLDLINTGSIDGEKIFDSGEIEISSQGTTVVLTSDWYNNDTVSIMNSDQSVTLNDLQASTLDSALAEDGFYYPGTKYKFKNINMPDGTISLNFNEEAILGTSTEVDIFVDSVTSLISGAVFVDPNAVAAAAVEEDPFAVAVDTNIEKVNLVIEDVESGSKLTDLVFSGLNTLTLSGGTSGKTFEITNPLDPSLVNLQASTVTSNLVLDGSLSNLQKSFKFGLGDDVLILGDSLIAAPVSDIISGGPGLDTLRISFANAIEVKPSISSFEELEIVFDGASTLDFSNVADVSELNILASLSPISFDNVPFDISNINVVGTQIGDWVLNFEQNASATPNIHWSNNTGNVNTVASLSFDEIKTLAINADGSDNVVISGLTIDPDDTSAISITNTDDGDLSISTGADITSGDSLTAITLISTEGGGIGLGSSAGNFGISEASKLSNVVLNASETGNIDLGRLGNVSSIEDLQNLSLTTSGAVISVGTITSKDVGTCNISVSSSGTVTLGDLNFQNTGSLLTASGAGTLSPLVFSNEAYATINLSDLVTTTSVDFSNAEKAVTIYGSSGIDTLTSGKGADIFVGNDGEDIFVIGNGKTGITVNTADKIDDFVSGQDKLKLGLAGDSSTDTGNFVKSTSPSLDFTVAFNSANTALTELNTTSSASELYSFQYDSNSGYLFVDTDSDGLADDLIILSNVESTNIFSTDIIA